MLAVAFNDCGGMAAFCAVYGHGHGVFILATYPEGT
jgi:hypothetical protein